MADITLQAAEYTKKKEAEEVAKPVSKFTHQQLLAALYWCHDVFDRASMLFFVIHDTAKQVIKNSELSGDSITVGVRELEWVSGGKRILDAFADHNRVPEKEEKDKVTYEFEGVPIVVTIFKDDLCITQCDTQMYEVEDFKIPNPYERFEKLYGQTQVS